jgi:hypothetical protein
VLTNARLGVNFVPDMAPEPKETGCDAPCGSPLDWVFRPIAPHLQHPKVCWHPSTRGAAYDVAILVRALWNLIPHNIVILSNISAMKALTDTVLGLWQSGNARELEGYGGGGEWLIDHGQAILGRSGIFRVCHNCEPAKSIIFSKFKIQYYIIS